MKLLLKLVISPCVALFFSFAAQAGLITNGDFETGDLSGWTTFATSNGTIGTPSVTSFDTSGGGPSLAATLNVGVLQFPGGNNGGGIRQSFGFSGGNLAITADVATTVGIDPNIDGGTFSLFVNNILQDTFTSGRILVGAVKRSTLTASFSGLAAGIIDLEILAVRSFQTASNTPLQYIDNVVATGLPGGTVPAPATFALMGVGLAGLGWKRRKA